MQNGSISTSPLSVQRKEKSFMNQNFLFILIWKYANIITFKQNFPYADSLQISLEQQPCIIITFIWYSSLFSEMNNLILYLSQKL